METISKKEKDKVVVWHGFLKWEWLIKPMTFYNQMSDVNEETTVKVICVNLSYAFEAFSRETLTDKLIKYVLHKWTVKWIENYMNFQAQKIVTSSVKSR